MPAATRRQHPPQHQSQRPGLESRMTPRPQVKKVDDVGNGKLNGKTALITGGDSGIGRAVAILFAREGANVAISYLDEHADADETKRLVEQEGRKCLLIPGYIGDEIFCYEAVDRTVAQYHQLDILVNNASEQHPQERFEDITADQLERTFRTNVFGYFFMAQAAVRHLHPGASIINTVSVTAYRGSPKLIDYSATKGAEVAFTRSLSLHLIERGIRVNAVAPGPIWTPLTPSTLDEKKVAEIGSTTPMGRAGEPEEVAPSYVFLASEDAAYISGQVIHPNGGEVVNG